MSVASVTSKSVWATLPRTERGRPLVLGADPKGKNFLYCHANSVIIRDLAHPEISDVYTQHSCQVNVAKYAPSGFYIASADKSGKVRIWDTVNTEHILKSEYQPISGPIYDLAWSPDNQRIVVVGEGREKFGHVFLADTGTSNGDVSGQTRPVNSCDFRPARPFRIITGSEDNSVAHYEGPPFKFKGVKSDHNRYCQSVRYSPDGAFWASAGFDGKIFLYEGKESELISEFAPEGKNAHAGGIYALAWNPNSKTILSASGDKTCKIWDIETKRAVYTISMGDEVEDQQLGCLWSGEYLISISLSGYINYLDPRTPKPVKVIKGHNKPITKMVKDKSGKTLVSAGSDGRVISWNIADGVCATVTGEGHNSQVNGLTCVQGSKLASVGIDDSLRYLDGGLKAYLKGDTTKLAKQPKAVSHQNTLTAVATLDSIALFKDGILKHEMEIDFEPGAIAVKDDHELVVGEASGGFNLKVYGVASDATSLSLKKTVKLSGAVTDIAFSPDGHFLVSSDGNRKVTLFNTDYEKPHQREWGFHTAKVNCVAWSPDSKFVASGGLDCAIIIWSVNNPEKHTITTSAHAQSQITAITWIDNKTVASTGQDGNIKIWSVELK